MSSINTISAPATEKAHRKAATADVNDQTMFRQTKFGRQRIPSIFGRLFGCIVLLGVPFAFLSRAISRSKPPC